MKIEYEFNPKDWPVINRFVDGPTTAEAIQGVDADAAIPTKTARDDGVPVAEDMAELQRSLIASSGVNFESGFVDVGDHWARAMFVEHYPDIARNGFLQPLFGDSSRQVDITTHVNYADQESVKHQLEGKLADLEADVQTEGDKLSAIRHTVAKVRNEVQAIYDAHQEGVPAVDTSMYLITRGDSKEQVRKDSKNLRDTLAKNPTNIKATTARGKSPQKLAYQSASPIATDFLGKRRVMMSKAVASMFFFGNTTFIEPSGTLLGHHAFNGEPVIADRYARETGYNWLVIGDIGSGKSFFSKLSLLRQYLNDDDCILVMMDPLEGFAGLNEALGGKRVIVGGDEGVNPLELNPTPEGILRRTQGLDPYGNKLEDVDSFFENYFALRDASDHFSTYRDVYDTIVKETYKEAGISRVPYTHKRPSPTICPLPDEPDRANLFDVSIDIIENPDEYADTASEESRIKDGATWFKRQLEPFRPGGKYANLGGTTDIDVTAHDILYLDLQQMEGRSSVGLMIQQMMSAVYERAKTTDKKIIFAIDESRYLTKNAANLEFLEQEVRHSRHYDLSIQFITQTIDEWFDRPEAKAIAENCAMRTLFKTEGLDESWATKLDMNERERNFGAKATAGNEDAGYSECLFGVSDDKGGGEKTEWYPMHVQASDAEAAVVDFEADKQSYTDLPGMTDGMARKREAEIEASYAGYYDEPVPDAAGEPTAAADGGEDQSVEERAAAVVRSMGGDD